VTTAATSRAKLQSNVTNKPIPNFLQAGCPSCRPTNSVKALKGILFNLSEVSKPSQTVNIHNNISINTVIDQQTSRIYI